MMALLVMTLLYQKSDILGNMSEKITKNMDISGIPGVKIRQYSPDELPDAYKDKHYEDVTTAVEWLMKKGFNGNSDLSDAIARKRKKGNFDPDNLSTQLVEMIVDGSEHWIDLIPRAAALDAVYDPEVKTLANGHPVTPEMKEWLSNVHDAIGLRSRAELMKKLVIEEVLKNPFEQQKWVSLACGAAQPVYDAMMRLQEMGGVTPDVTLVDHDPEALSLAVKSAEEKGVGQQVHTRRMNILKPGGLASPVLMDKIAQSLGTKIKLHPNEFDIVDAVGILEYLGNDDFVRSFEYGGVIKSKRTFAGAPTFLKNAYEITRPGGLLLIGNMLDTHPQLGFTLNTLQWSHIQPRSIQEMSGLIESAGLRGADIEAHCPADGVYALYTIRKPN